MTQDDQAGTVERMVKIGLFWMTRSMRYSAQQCLPDHLRPKQANSDTRAGPRACMPALAAPWPLMLCKHVDARAFDLDHT